MVLSCEPKSVFVTRVNKTLLPHTHNHISILPEMDCWSNRLPFPTLRFDSEITSLVFVAVTEQHLYLGVKLHHNLSWKPH